VDKREDVGSRCFGVGPCNHQVAELVRSGYLDIKPKVMKRLSMRYPFLEAEVVFAVQQVQHAKGGMVKIVKQGRLRHGMVKT
jgi:hypothetical protein